MYDNSIIAQDLEKKYTVGWYTKNPFKNGWVQSNVILGQGIFTVRTGDIISLKTIQQGKDYELDTFKELLTKSNW